MGICHQRNNTLMTMFKYFLPNFGANFSLITQRNCPIIILVCCHIISLVNYGVKPLFKTFFKSVLRLFIESSEYLYKYFYHIISLSFMYLGNYQSI